MQQEMGRTRSPAFRSMVRGATGGGEIWTHANEDVKVGYIFFAYIRNTYFFS